MLDYHFHSLTILELGKLSKILKTKPPAQRNSGYSSAKIADSPIKRVASALLSINNSPESAFIHKG